MSEKNNNAACKQINCHVLLLVNYQKGSCSTQHNEPVSVPQCSWCCSGQESPATLCWKGHHAPASVGARGSHTEMSPCDVTINVTAVNKVSTSDVCASVHRDLSSSAASFLFMFHLRQSRYTVYLPFQSQLFCSSECNDVSYFFSTSLSPTEHN